MCAWELVFECNTGVLGDVVLVSAEGAEANAVSCDSFFNSAVGQGISVVESAAVLVGVINLAVGGPVNGALDVGSCCFKLFRGNRVPVVAGNTTDEQCNDSDYSCNGLGLLVQVLVLEEKNDVGDEGDDAYDDAHIVVEPEEELVLLGHGLNVVGLLPELSADDDAGKVENQENDELSQSGQEGNVELAQNGHNAQNFECDGCDPENDCACSETAGISYRLSLFQLVIGFSTCCNHIVSFLFCHIYFLHKELQNNNLLLHKTKAMSIKRGIINQLFKKGCYTMTNSEVKKKMLTKGRVEEICRASGASDEEVKSVLTSALPLLLGTSGSSGSSSSNSGLSLLTGLLSSQTQQTSQQSSGLTLIQDEPQTSNAGLSLLSGLLGGGSQSQSNVAGSLLSTLLGASGTSQSAAEEQVSQQTGVGKNKVSLIMLAAIPLLLKMLKDDNSSSSSSSTGTGKKKKKPASGSSSSSSNQSASISDLLLSLLK